MPPIQDIYARAMNAGVPSSLEYAGEIAEIPSATHQMISWGELVGKEDKLAMRAYLKATSGYDCTTHASGTVYVEPAPRTSVFMHGAQMKRPSPADGQRGSTLSAFVADFAKRDGAWAAAARDPQCAKALGRLRRRVAELDDPMVAAQPSEWAHKIMNGQDGSDQGPRHQLMLTSLANPLTYNAMLKPKPKPRAATRRAAGEAVGEPTSFWNASWGAAAGPLTTPAVDLNFDYGRSAVGGWRGGGMPKGGFAVTGVGPGSSKYE